MQSSPAHEIKSEVQSRMRPFFAGSSENLNNTSSNQNNSDSCDDNKADCEIIELVIEEGIENEDYLHNDNVDGDRFDEDLGDISSDETAESPVPDIEKAENKDSYEKYEQEQAHVLETEKERKPSRISLETPL